MKKANKTGEKTWKSKVFDNPQTAFITNFDKYNWANCDGNDIITQLTLMSTIFKPNTIFA